MKFCLSVCLSVSCSPLDPQDFYLAHLTCLRVRVRTRLVAENRERTNLRSKKKVRKTAVVSFETKHTYGMSLLDLVSSEGPAYLSNRRRVVILSYAPHSTFFRLCSREAGRHFYVCCCHLISFAWLCNLQCNPPHGCLTEQCKLALDRT